MKYFAFDLETTGVNVMDDEPVEIAFSIFDDLEPGAMSITRFWVDTKRECNIGALKVHGIGTLKTRLGIPCDIAATMMSDLIKRHEITHFIGYNAFKFDVPMLFNWMKRYAKDFSLDRDKFFVEDPAIWYLADFIHGIPRPTDRAGQQALAETRVPFGTRYNLGVACERHGITLTNSHQAEGDLSATIKLWYKMRGAQQALA